MASAGTSGTNLRAGTAKTDITIESSHAPIRDRLFVKALVLDDGQNKFVLITMDVTAIGARWISDGMLPDVSESFLPSVRERIQKQLGIPGEHVTVNASHTHPPGKMLCDDDAQIERTCDAVRRAFDNMVPVTVGAGVGHEDRITMNRTLRLKDGNHWTIRHANPCPPDEEVVDVGPHDPQIGILRVDRLDGRPLAVVYNFATHLLYGDTTGSITANFTGIASKLIEDTLGDAIAFFVQGAAGDVIDITFKDFNQPRDIVPLGMTLGESVLKTVREIRTTCGKINVIDRVLKLPLRTDIPERIAKLESQQTELLESLRGTSLNLDSFLPLYLRSAIDPEKPADYTHRYLQSAKIGSDQVVAMDALNRRLIDKYVRNIRAMERLTRIRENIDTLHKHQRLISEMKNTTVTAEVQGIRIGDFVLITAPIEVLTEVSLNIKKSSPHKHTFVAGFTNGYLHYGAPASYYDKGGYEVTECLLAPQWQAVFEGAVKEMLAQL
jgi:hypothetical protein